MAALHSICYRAINYLENEDLKQKELRKIQQIGKNNNYNPKIINRIVKKIEEKKKQKSIKKKTNEEKKQRGAITYIGYQTKMFRKIRNTDRNKENEKCIGIYKKCKYRRNSNNGKKWCIQIKMWGMQ